VVFAGRSATVADGRVLAGRVVCPDFGTNCGNSFRVAGTVFTFRWDPTQRSLIIPLIIDSLLRGSVLTESQQPTISEKDALGVTTVFQKPPLVELIAELRWGAPIFGIVPGGAGGFAFQTPIGPDGQPQAVEFAIAATYDSFFMRFAVEAYRLGFTIQERVAPPNSILMPYQTVWRWRKPDVDGLFLQLGAGVFTVNGGPPGYSHWGNFVSTVQLGVAGLLAALDSYPGARPTSFSQTLLRYIDLFDGQLAKNKPPLQFFHEVMGLKIELPEVVSKLASTNGVVIPMLNLQIPIKDGTLTVTFGNGVVKGQNGHIFDSTVVRNVAVALASDAVAESFTASHAVTNELFMALTKPLHEEMEPLK
jgi:uncharacterized protein (TIGR04255 family)